MIPGGVYLVAFPAAQGDSANPQSSSRFQLNNAQFQSSLSEAFTDSLWFLWDRNTAVVRR